MEDTRSETTGDGSATSKIVEKNYKEEWGHGLRLRAFHDGTLQVSYTFNDETFECTLQDPRTIRSSTLPLAMSSSLLEDIKKSSLEVALAHLPGRIKAYVARRQQVLDTERKHGSRLRGGKVETAGSCTFVRLDMLLTIEGSDGVLRLDLSYDDFSPHPRRTVVSCEGPDDVVELVRSRAEDIRDLLQSSFLDEACDVLSS